MKKAFILVALASVTVFSCTKNHSTYTTVDAKDTTGYVVGGISDMQLESRDSVIVPISVEWVSGKQNRLSFSISGLPANVSAKFSPESGYSNFTTMLTLVSKKAALGTYPVKIMLKDSVGNSVRTYDVALTIGPKMLCVNELFGSYVGDYTCTADSLDSVAMTVTMAPMSTGTDNMIAIHNLSFQQFSVNAKLSCQDQKIMIHSQNFGMYNVSGSGDFVTDSTIMLNYRIINNAFNDTSNCTAIMKRRP
jgi:hypothetical protein